MFGQSVHAHGWRDRQIVAHRCPTGFAGAKSPAMSTGGKKKKKKSKKYRNAEEELYSYASHGKTRLLAALLGLPFEEEEETEKTSARPGSPARSVSPAPQSPMDGGGGTADKVRTMPVHKVDPRDINPNWANDAHKGMTPLMAAAQQGKLPAMEMLLAFGAKIDTTDGSGATALMYACNRGQLQCVEALVLAGAKLDLRNDAGFTALAIAVGYDKEDCVRVLLQAGARPKQGVGNRCDRLGEAAGEQAARKPVFSLTAETVAHEFDREGPLNELRLAVAAPPAALDPPSVHIVSDDAVHVGFSAPLRPGDCPLRGFELLVVPPLPPSAVAVVVPGGPGAPTNEASASTTAPPTLMITADSVRLDAHWKGDADEEEEVMSAAEGQGDASNGAPNGVVEPMMTDADDGIGGVARVSVHVTPEVSEAAARAIPAAMAASGGKVPTVQGALLLSGLDCATRYTVQVRALCDGSPRPSSRTGTNGFSHEHGEAHWKNLRGVLSAAAPPVCTRSLAVGRASRPLRGGLLLGSVREAGAALSLWIPPGGLRTWWQRRPGGGGAAATQATIAAAAGASLRAARSLWNSAPIAVDGSLRVYNAESVRLGVEAVSVRPLPRGVAAVSAVVEVGLCAVPADQTAEAAMNSRSLIPSARFRRRVPSTLRLSHSAVVYGGPEPDGLVVLFSAKMGLAAMPEFEDSSVGTGKPTRAAVPGIASWGPWRAVSSMSSAGGVAVDTDYETDEGAYEDAMGNANPTSSGLVGPCRFEASGSHVSIMLSCPGRFVVARLQDDAELDYAAAQDAAFTAANAADAADASTKRETALMLPLASSLSPSKREEHRRRRRKKLARTLALPARMPSARTQEAREYVQCLAFADVAPAARPGTSASGTGHGRFVRLALVLCPSRDDALCNALCWAATRGLRAVGALQLTAHGGLEAQERAQEYEAAAHEAGLQADDDEEDDMAGDPSLMGRLDAGLGGNCAHSVLALAPGDAVQLHAFGVEASHLPIQPATAAAAMDAAEQQAAWQRQLTWAWGHVEHCIDILEVPLRSPRNPLCVDQPRTGNDGANRTCDIGDGVAEGAAVSRGDTELGLIDANTHLIGQWDRSVFAAEPQLETPGCKPDASVPSHDARTMGETAVALGGGVTVRVRFGIRRQAKGGNLDPAWPMGDEDEAMWLTARVPTEALGLGPPKPASEPTAAGGNKKAAQPAVPRAFDGGAKVIRNAFSEVTMLYHALGQLETTAQRIAQESAQSSALLAAQDKQRAAARESALVATKAAAAVDVPTEGGGLPAQEQEVQASSNACGGSDDADAKEQPAAAHQLAPPTSEPSLADEGAPVPPTAGAALAAASTDGFAHNPTVGVIRVLAAAAAAVAATTALPAGTHGEGSAKRVECMTLAHRLEALSTAAAALASEPVMWASELALFTRLANRALEVLRGCTEEGAAGAEEEDEGNAAAQHARAACAGAISAAIAAAKTDADADDVAGAAPEDDSQDDHRWQGWLMRFISSGDENSLWHSCAFAALDAQLQSLTRRCAAMVRASVKVGEKRFAHLAPPTVSPAQQLAPIDGVTPSGAILGIERHYTAEAKARAAAAAAAGEELECEDDDPRIAEIMAFDFNRNQALHALLALQDGDGDMVTTADDCIEWLVSNPDTDELALEPPVEPESNNASDEEESERKSSAGDIDDGGYALKPVAPAATWLADSSLLSAAASAVSIGDSALLADWWGVDPARNIRLGLTATPFGDSDTLAHSHIRTLLAVMAELPLLESLAAETAAAVGCEGTATAAEAADAETAAAAGRCAAAAASQIIAQLFGTTASRVAAEMWQPRMSALMAELGMVWHEWTRPWGSVNRREHAQRCSSAVQQEELPQLSRGGQEEDPRSLVAELLHRRHSGSGTGGGFGNNRLGLELVLAKMTTAVALRVEDESAAEARVQAEAAAIAAAEARAHAAGKPVPPRPPPVSADGKPLDGCAARKLLRWLQARRAVRLRVARVAADSALQSRNVDERQLQRTVGVAQQLQRKRGERKARRKARRKAESAAAWQEEEGRLLRNEALRVARIAQRAAKAALGAAIEAQKLAAQAQEDVEAATARVAKMEAALALAAQAQQELAQQAEAEAGAD